MRRWLFILEKNLLVEIMLHHPMKNNLEHIHHINENL